MLDRAFEDEDDGEHEDEHERPEALRVTDHEA
jgi:hypothetical protein